MIKKERFHVYDAVFLYSHLFYVDNESFTRVTRQRFFPKNMFQKLMKIYLIILLTRHITTNLECQELNKRYYAENHGHLCEGTN